MGFAVVAMAASTLISAASAIQQGRVQASAAKAQAQQYKEAANESKIQTLQEETIRRRRLYEMTGSNQLDIAARGVDPDSPSYQAIEAESARAGEADIRAGRYIGESRTRRFELASTSAMDAAKSYSTGGWLTGLATLGRGAYQGWQGMTGSPGTSIGYMARAIHAGRGSYEDDPAFR